MRLNWAGSDVSSPIDGRRSRLRHRHRDLFGLRLGAADHCIEDPAVIKKILAHLDKKEACAQPVRLPPSRAPPPAGLFD
jgi:hypothetical protein